MSFFSSAGIGGEDSNGNSYWLIHRADYQKLLFDAAAEHGATIKLGSWVDSVDAENVTVTLASGEVLSADLIIGADGKPSSSQPALMKTH